MKVAIGVTDYDLKKISTEDMLEKSEGIIDVEEAVVGCLERFSYIISINKDFGTQAKQQTFWHETVHAMLDEIGESELCEDEDFVDAFAKQIYGFIRRNKIDKIYAYLGEGNERTN